MVLCSISPVSRLVWVGALDTRTACSSVQRGGNEQAAFSRHDELLPVLFAGIYANERAAEAQHDLFSGVFVHARTYRQLLQMSARIVRSARQFWAIEKRAPARGPLKPTFGTRGPHEPQDMSGQMRFDLSCPLLNALAPDSLGPRETR